MNHKTDLDSFKAKALWLLALLLLFAALFLAREALVVVFTAFIFASAMLPMVEALDRRLPRWLAVTIPILLLTLVVVGLVFPLFIALFQQLQLFITDLPKYLDDFVDWANGWSFMARRYPFLSDLSPNALLAKLSQQNLAVFYSFTGMTMLVSQVALDLLSALVISIFLLLDRERIQRYFLRFHPSHEHTRLNALIEHLIRSTGAFVTGQLLFMISFGGLIAVGLHLLHIPFAALLGFITGLLTIIPILGPNIAMIPALLLALLTPGGMLAALWVFLLYVVVQVVENNFIGPLIMGRAVGLHPLAILLAILFGGMMFGMVGIVLAIPVAACLNILLHEWFLHKDSEIIHPLSAE